MCVCVCLCVGFHNQWIPQKYNLVFSHMVIGLRWACETLSNRQNNEHFSRILSTKMLTVMLGHLARLVAHTHTLSQMTG